MDANGLIDTGLTPERLAELDIGGGDQTDLGMPVEYVSGYGDGDMDLFGALGTYHIRLVRLTVDLFKSDSGWRRRGQADFEYRDRYDFDQHGGWGQFFRDCATKLFAEDRSFDIAALDALRTAGLARPFDISASWTWEIDLWQ